MAMRQIRQIISGVPTTDGAGVNLTRIIGNLHQIKQAMFEPVEGAVPKRDVDGVRKKVVGVAKDMEKDGAFIMEDFSEGGGDMVE